MKRLVSVGVLTSLALSAIGGCSGPVRSYSGHGGDSGSDDAHAGRGAQAGAAGKTNTSGAGHAGANDANAGSGPEGTAGNSNGGTGGMPDAVGGAAPNGGALSNGGSNGGAAGAGAPSNGGALSNGGKGGAAAGGAPSNGGGGTGGKGGAAAGGAPSNGGAGAGGSGSNCNGALNPGCECVNGSAVACACGPTTTCTNGVKGTCSVTKVTMYVDSDGDGYGTGAATQQCPGTSGYSNNANDCDDNNGSFKPNISLCSTVSQKRTCPASGGVASAQPCDQGCLNGNCRTDGTIGLPGYVSCVNSSHCLAADGCNMDDASGGCGASSSVVVYCDGPNDCPGQKCVFLTSRPLNEAKCYATQPPDLGDGNSYRQVCDPLASDCRSPLSCVKEGRYPLYLCQ